MNSVLSNNTSNLVIYLTLIILLVNGLLFGYYFKSKKNFIYIDGTQKAFPLSLSLIATGKLIFFIFFKIFGWHLK